MTKKYRKDRRKNRSKTRSGVAVSQVRNTSPTTISDANRTIKPKPTSVSVQTVDRHLHIRQELKYIGIIAGILFIVLIIFSLILR